MVLIVKFHIFSETDYYFHDLQHESGQNRITANFMGNFLQLLKATVRVQIANHATERLDI